MLNRSICFFKGHKFVLAGTCPFTQRTYNVCTKCNKIDLIYLDLSEKIDDWKSSL